MAQEKRTQAERILDLLREAGVHGVSNYELMKISYQYPARLHTLRHKEGHVISATHVKDSEWRIVLEHDAKKPAPKIEYVPVDDDEPTQNTMFDIPQENKRKLERW